MGATTDRLIDEWARMSTKALTPGQAEGDQQKGDYPADCATMCNIYCMANHLKSPPFSVDTSRIAVRLKLL
jgi:hypothetical protein